MDFLTPPTPTELQAIRVRVESSLPRADQVDDAISVPVLIPPPAPPPPPVEKPKPVIELGDLKAPPTLQSYAEQSPKGSEYLIALANVLEQKGEFQRALLAWERVIDSTKPDESQAGVALAAIKRLRPTLPDWSAKPATSIVIALHAGTGKKLAKTLTPVLEAVARDLEKASSGIVKVKATVDIGKTSSATKGPTPVALWLAGTDKKPSSTEVLSFTVDAPDALRQDILKTVYLLVRSHLSRSTAHTPPPGLSAHEDPQDALHYRITRLGWRDFATSLTLPPKKTP